MVEQPRNQVSEMLFDKFPDPSAFQCWKTSFKTEVCSCSSFPTDAMLWIKEVEMVESVDDLKTSQSIEGHRFPNFEMLDAQDCVCFEKDHHEPLLQKGDSAWWSTGRRCKTDFSAEDRLHEDLRMLPSYCS